MKQITFLILVTLAACKAEPSKNSAKNQHSASSGLQFEAIADKITERLALQTGERVLLVGQPGGDFDPIIPLLARNIAANDAVYLGTLSVNENQPESWSTNFTNGATGKTGEELEAYFRQCDVGIMLPGAVPSDIPYRAMQNILDTGSVRTIHFHWSGAYAPDMEPLEISDEISKAYQNALLGTDYTALSKKQHELEESMRKSVIRVTTPAGTDISFKIGDRPVTKQDGDASALRARAARNLIDREVELPAGAVRVAPIEESVNGVIAFPTADWQGTIVEGLRLTVNKGVVTSWSAKKGVEAYEAEVKSAGAGASAFREFALGLNPLLAISEKNPWIPYYGYGAGVVRLSLGDNVELGGNVGGGYVRWNFFTDATVTIGDVVWVENGKLIIQ